MDELVVSNYTDMSTPPWFVVRALHPRRDTEVSKCLSGIKRHVEYFCIYLWFDGNINLIWKHGFNGPIGFPPSSVSGSSIQFGPAK